MPEWSPWAALILLAVAAGWAWDTWRHRPARQPRPARTRPTGSRTPRSRPGSRAAGSPAGRSGASTRSRPAGGRRSGGPAAPPRPRDADRHPTGTPRAGEIWWADVPFADGTGSKVRPCLVLGVDRRHADVLKITSRDRSDRDDHVPIPTRDWDPDAEHDSYLDLGESIRVTLDAFDNRAGTCDPPLWRKIRTLPHLRPHPTP
ncbi:PemK family transcriptional regulator [Micromonospora rosaria]|uniref:PemK family transcriptional regulator n=1 Tax=Micromonospora rosaria TaxID=47874 RepID=A0A136PII7_9ACTN|nr:type II toxin-antitoxin system PemK/MazF family toxin [Micromonospora rosaria]KXK58213.1 PemK family transcriptional regulator [Micromonospora rosaria]